MKIEHEQINIYPSIKRSFHKFHKKGEIRHIHVHNYFEWGNINEQTINIYPSIKKSFHDKLILIYFYTPKL